MPFDQKPIRVMLATCLLAVFLCGSATAGILTSHSYVDARAFAENGRDPIDVRVRTIESDLGGTTGLVTAGLEGFYAEAIASTSTDAAQLLRLGSRAYYVFGSPEANGRGQANSIASARWRDVAFVGGDYPFITLHFSVDAVLSASSNVALSVYGSTINPHGFAVLQLGTAQLRDLGAGPALEVSGWDHFGIGHGGGIFGTFHTDVPYNAALGGYAWDVSMTGSAGAGFNPNDVPHDQFGEVDAGHSLALQLVTDPNGNPITPTFDSGLTLSAAAVPEPASIAIWGVVGAFGLAAVARRRRNARKVDR